MIHLKSVLKNGIMLLGILFPMTMTATNLYICGGFQGWDPTKALEFKTLTDGRKSLEVDLSSNAAFKISTQCPTSSTDAWSVFDSGALDLAANSRIVENAYLKLQSGVANITAPKKQKYTIIVNLEDSTLVFYTGSGPIVDLEHPWSGTLPVLFINTVNNEPVVSKEMYLDATYYFDPMGVEGVREIGTKEKPLSLQIKGRGNYSWRGFDKKPYRLKLGSKEALLGMKKNKHFALLAHADDPYGFMRNAVGFQLSRLIGMEWTPADHPCEVVLNGDYIGLYFLTETIRVDKDRVNVYEQPDSSDTDVTGGWLVEIDNYDSDPHLDINIAGSGVRFFTYKSPELLCDAQKDWLATQLNTIEKLVNTTDTENAEWMEYVDKEALAMYYIVQEIMDDYESFWGSCYMSHDIDNAELSADGKASHKWKFGPVWDFGSSFNYAKKEFIYQGREYPLVWIGKMCRYEQFEKVVKEKWNNFYRGDYSDIYGYIDTLASKINVAAQYDHWRWPKYGTDDEMRQAAYVKEWLAASTDWLNRQWGDNSGRVETETVPKTEILAAVGGIRVIAEKQCDITVASLDGCSRIYNVEQGETMIDLAPGFYVANGTKIIVR